MTTPSVFISYSHDSPEHADRVLALANRLCQEGIDAILDQYESSPPEGWPRWMDKQIRAADWVLMVCTVTYFRRVMGEEKPGTGLGVKWEGNLIYQHIYNADTRNTRFIPVLFKDCPVEHIPTPLQGATYYRIDAPDGYEDLYRRLTNQPKTIKPELGKLKSLPPRERKPDYLGIKVSLAKLPSTDPTLFGRDDRLKELDEAWVNQKINVVSLVAWGGVGKTALVNKWLSQMARENFRGAERVFGWSFYSQGAAEGRQVSADPFIAAALRWFGDPAMADSSASPWDKGERLAELFRQQRTLLILDGLEPLQNPPPVETGKVKDPGLTSLLRELARQNPGLVVISTRLLVDDLKDFTVIASAEGAKQSPSDSEIASSPQSARLLAMTGSAIEIDLENLSPEAGAAYLEHLGVEGTDEERKETARDFGGHALTLTLLGRYLQVVHHGDIRKRREIQHVMDEQKQGAHARRVMESYERWLRSKPELDILCLMGLFDRPAERGALDALRKEPAIEGLTDALQKLKDADWQFAVANLRHLRLLSDPEAGAPETLDCHPLLREHFGEKLKASNPKAWREAHGRLYEYYKSTVKEYPDTIEEMAPLYTAVMHGCQAGKHQEALDEVYWRRIQRGDEYFTVKKLGAFGADLSALSEFFNPPWSEPVATLREGDKGLVLNSAGAWLRALGQLVEAAQPMQASLDAVLVRGDWKNAAIAASGLSELYLAIGNVTQAIDYAQQSVELGDRSGDAFARMAFRTTLADTLHQAGRLGEAEATFGEAEETQKKDQPEFPLLYSLQGYHYCDLLLGQGKYAEVQRRAEKMFAWRLPADSLLTIAVDNLSLGRALTRSPSLPRTTGKRKGGGDALAHLNRAVDGLRQAGAQHYLPRGLLARAEFYRVTSALEKAEKDLDEAFTIAARGGMGLHLADCHLEYARLWLARGEKEKAREHLSIAKQMIDKMGYHRRDGAVKELQEQL